MFSIYLSIFFYFLFSIIFLLLFRCSYISTKVLFSIFLLFSILISKLYYCLLRVYFYQVYLYSNFFQQLILHLFYNSTPKSSTPPPPSIILCRTSIISIISFTAFLHSISIPSPSCTCFNLIRYSS